MDRTCKCCGQTMPRPLGVETLKGKTAKIVDAIWRAGANGLDSSRLIDVVYGDDPNGGPLYAEKSIHVLIHRANHVHLNVAGYAIRGENTGGRAHGRYRIVKCEATQ